MNDRSSLKKQELEHLRKVYAEHPELVEQYTFYDDEETLAKVGIRIPEKDSFPNGYLKLWPQDFIVEEIGLDGTVYTIEYERTLNEGVYAVKPGDQTIYATLVKCGVSTIEAIDEILKITGALPEQIQYAGIKDKDAITAQRISFRNIPLEKIAPIRSPHFFLKDVASGKGAVGKSELKGNRFTILVRTESGFPTSDSFYVFTKHLKMATQQGFYNFYYLQRFGNPRLNNYLVGLSILKGDYKKAVHDAITLSGSRENAYFKNLRYKLSGCFGDWKMMESLMSPLPLIFGTELKMVRHLLNTPDDYIGALNSIRDQVQLWVYAISSFVFNQKISDLIARDFEIPSELPLLLSREKNDWAPYTDSLKELDIFPPPFHHLRPFPFLQLRHRTVPAVEQATFHDAQIIPEGIVLSFTLNKGGYATTLLSHMFNITSGFPPPDISSDLALPRDTLGPCLEYFKDSIRPKNQDLTQEEDK